MGRIASDTTLLRSAKKTLLERSAELMKARIERDHYRTRATKAEQEAKEWKDRFDILLRRDNTPTAPPPAPGETK